MKKYVLGILGTIVLFSCKEDTRINLIQGQLFQECNQVFSGAEIALKTNETGSFNNSLILGNAITDGNGNYRFTYELEEGDVGKGDLILVKSTGFETLISDITLNTDLSIILYRKNTAEVFVQLSGSKNFGAADTLFYGVEASEFFEIEPSNNFSDTLQLDVPNSVNGSATSIFYYGVGSTDFNRAKAAVTDNSSNFQNMALTLQSCSIDTVSFAIN